MTIDVQLTKSQFTRLAILYHIQRKQFYFYAITAAVISAVAFIQQIYPLLVAVWLPFLMYLAIGIGGAYRDGNKADNPALQPTSYKFTEAGVTVSTAQGSSQLSWGQLSGWSVIAGTYVITLKQGSMLAIPQSAVKTTQVAKFKAMLNKHLKK
ncbi:MAG: hypothetical protein Kow0031_12470 [Anaerolineae bacterium]